MVTLNNQIKQSKQAILVNISTYKIIVNRK